MVTKADVVSAPAMYVADDDEADLFAETWAQDLLSPPPAARLPARRTLRDRIADAIETATWSVWGWGLALARRVRRACTEGLA